MTFATLFDRASAVETDVEAVRRELAARRSDERDSGDRERRAGSDNGPDPGGSEDGEPGEASEPPEPNPARVVADADVLAADLLVGEASRAALDHLRRHSWTTLVASDPLLADAEAVVASVADESLAADWRDRVEGWREPVAQPPGDHPALASAYRGGAMQVVSLDASLTGPGAGAGLQGRFPVSVREPQAFATVFSPERLHPEVVGGEYSGPDRDPRE